MRSPLTVLVLLLLVAVAAVQPGVAQLVEQGLHTDCPADCRCDSPSGNCSSSCDDCTCCRGTIPAIAPWSEPRVAACEVSETLPAVATRLSAGPRPQVYRPPRPAAAC